MNKAKAFQSWKELPPRARRIPTSGELSIHTNGTTSACAENTEPSVEPSPHTRNYLRVRGEYFWEHGFFPNWAELPPRARRIPPLKQCCGLSMGTTSACAENTKTAQDANYHTRNYLRVRGEYALTCGLRRRLMELPPRARRIHGMWLVAYYVGGTTSACAENTGKTASAQTAPGNYLRVRGEYPPKCRAKNYVSELPPRARRIQCNERVHGHHGGTTSACAENTSSK